MSPTTRKTLLLLVPAILLAGGIAFLLPVVGRPSLTTIDAAAQRVALLQMVPGEADDVYVLPKAASLVQTLRRHPITGAAVTQLGGDDAVMLTWLIGNGDLVVWRQNSDVSFAAAPGAFRRLLLKPIIPLVRGARPLAWNGPYLVSSSRPLAASAATRETAPTRDVRGHLFVLRDEGAFAAITLNGDDVELLQRKRASGSSAAGRAFRLPTDAILSAGFSGSPPMLRRLEKIFPLELSRLFEQGGVISVYSVDVERLLPKIRLALEVPATMSAEPTAPSIGERTSTRTSSGVSVTRKKSLGFTIEEAVRGDSKVISFDSSSMDRYLGARETITADPASHWTLQLKPATLGPIVKAVQEHPAYELLGEDGKKKVEELARWLPFIREAKSAVASGRTAGGIEEIAVSVHSAK